MGDQVRDRDGNVCQERGDDTVQEQARKGEKLPPNQSQIDHIVPRAKGGTNDLGNLRNTCQICNGSKSDRFP